MGSWLKKSSVSRAANEAAGHALAAVRRVPVGDLTPVVRCEALEGRTFLSASPADLTNVYAGSLSYKVGKHKVKEAITLTLTTQSATGYVSGQIASSAGGTVDVSGKVSGKSVLLVGSSSGRLIKASVGGKGKSIGGTLVNGADSTVAKFKVKRSADAPAALAAAPASTAATQVFVPRAVPLTSTNAADGLDPTIDPTTGLPIDPVTGLPIDPSTTPGETDGGTIGGAPVDGGTVGGGAGGTPVQANPGQPIGTNQNFLGIWTGSFNPPDGNGDPQGGIVDPNDPTNPSPTDPIPDDDTIPGVDERAVTFTTTSQDITGLVAGTLEITQFGTFTYTGFVNGAHVDLVLTGVNPGENGSVSFDFDATAVPAYSAFSGTVIDAVSNGFVANGPINAVFSSDVPLPPVPPVPLPAGTELYTVGSTDINGDNTVGNFDPNGATLGEDFAVGTTPLVINSLGAFDDGGDGLNNTIRVAIYDTNSPGSPIVVQDITTANSSLADSSGFRYLTTFTPVTLQTGIYRIVAFGYGGTELAGDIGVDNYTGPVPTAATAGNDIQYPISNSLNSNNWISAAGSGSGNTVGSFTYPTQAQGLPLNRYLAGSFLFELGTPPDPGGGGGGGSPPPPPPPLTKPANSAYPGGVYTSPTGPEVFGSQSGGIIS